MPAHRFLSSFDGDRYRAGGVLPWAGEASLPARLSSLQQFHPPAALIFIYHASVRLGSIVSRIV